VVAISSATLNVNFSMYTLDWLCSMCSIIIISEMLTYLALFLFFFKVFLIGQY